MEAVITILPGDGIGPEVASAGVAVLEKIAAEFGHSFTVPEALIGGAAIDETGSPLPDVTLDQCRNSEAVLLGAVGGPKWSDPNASVRPEQGLLKIRAELGVFANLRPVQIYPELAGATILERRREARERYDHLRTALMLEPRGHADMYGCIVTPPVSEGADLGVLFLHNEGYSTMC